MRPNAVEILRSIGATFDEYLLPEISEPFAHSLALTVSNLLRHVTLRLEQEGRVLVAEIEDLRAVLSQARAFAASAGMPEVASEIEAVCAEEPASRCYVEIQDLEREVTGLRWALQHAIRALEQGRTGFEAREGYGELRIAIRQHLRRSLEREGGLVVPAFTGERR